MSWMDYHRKETEYMKVRCIVLVAYQEILTIYSSMIDKILNGGPSVSLRLS